MTIQSRADLNNLAIGWLQRGYSSVGGGTVVQYPLSWMSSGECRLNRAEKRRQRRLAEKSRRLAPASSQSTSQTPDIPKALGLALEHHNAGRLPEAKNICQQILRADPNQPMALHMLGLIALQVGKNDIAVDLITRALAVKPDFALAYNSLGIALKGLKRFDEAADQYQKGLAIKPSFAEAHYNLGNALLELGRLDEAVEHYRKAIDTKAKFAEAYYNLGNALKELGRLDEAVDRYQNAIDIKPDYAMAHHNLGNLLLERGQFEDAIRNYDLAALDSSRSKSLECLYALARHEEFYQRLDKLIEMDESDLRAAAISAFASQQLGRADPYPFCKNPMDFIRVYESLNVGNDADGFLHHLVDELKSRAVNWEPQGKTTRNGFQSPANLFINPMGSLADLEQLIKGQIENYCSEFSSENCGFMNFFPNKLSLSGWIVRLSKGGHQLEHIHPRGWLSGVFYLQVPKFSTREEGSIEFGLWGYNYPILKNSYPRKRVYPKNGNLVLFPSSLFHRTIPFDSNEERMSIAFDLIPS